MCSSYIKNQLQILHVGLLCLDELVDVTLSLPLLWGHGVQRHQVGTPCRAQTHAGRQACGNMPHTHMNTAAPQAVDTFPSITRTTSVNTCQNFIRSSAAFYLQSLVKYYLTVHQHGTKKTKHLPWWSSSSQRLHRCEANGS